MAKSRGEKSGCWIATCFHCRGSKPFHHSGRQSLPVALVWLFRTHPPPHTPAQLSHQLSCSASKIHVLKCGCFPKTWFFTQVYFSVFLFFLKDFIYLFLERKEEKEKERERNLNIRQKLTGCLLNAPWPGTKAAIQARALTGDQTGNLLPYGTMPKQRSHTGQDVVLCR